MARKYRRHPPHRNSNFEKDRAPIVECAVAAKVLYGCPSRRLLRVSWIGAPMPPSPRASVLPMAPSGRIDTALGVANAR